MPSICAIRTPTSEPYKCLRELAKLRAEDASKVGFESQKRIAAAEQRKNSDETRKQTAEIRKQELHAAR